MTTTNVATGEVPVLQRALAAIVGLDEVDGALALARVAAAKVPPPMDARGPFDLVRAAEARAVDAALAGEEPVYDVGERIRAELASNEAAAHDRVVAEGVVRTLRERSRSVLRAGADQALAVLADELRSLVADVRALHDELGPVRSADDAISACAGDAWSVLVALARRYHEVREAQVEVVAATGADSLDAASAARQLVQRAGVWVDHAEVDPLLRAIRYRRQTEDGQPLPIRAEAPIWPSPAEGSGWVPSTDAATWLRWACCAAPASLWVPLVGELREASRRVDALCEAPYQTRPGGGRR